MKKGLFLTLLILSVACLGSVTAVNAGGSVGNAMSDAAGDAVGVFLRSIGDYFSVPQKEVIVVRERNIPDDEIPVIFYLSQQAKVSPSTIMELRLKGMSWQEITNRYGLGPEIFYVPVKENVAVGPPYGHAYGYYKSKPRKEWHKIKLRDDDIVNLVNLKFISGHYNYPAATIIGMRGKNKGFYNISCDIEEQREANRKYANKSSNKQSESGNKSGNKGFDKADNSGKGKSDNKGTGNSGNKGNKKGK